jgi:hypothetical protein
MNGLVTVLSPSFLWLLPLAGLPVLFHLLMRRKQRRMVFSTLMFFRRVDPRLSSKRKLRELLLLAARMALVALVLLGLARPMMNLFGGIPGLSSNAPVTIVIDNSASMRAEAAGEKRSKLDLAVAAARNIVTSLPGGTPVALSVTVDDPKAAVPTEATNDRSRVMEFLEAIVPTDAAGNAATAIATAAKRVGAGGGVIHVLSDLQADEWGHEPATPEPQPNARVVFHRIPSEPVKGGDVAFTRASVVTPWPLVAQPVLFRAEVANAGDEPARIEVRTEDDGGRTMSRYVEVAAGGHETVDVTVEPGSKGTHWVRCSIEGDAFTGNNQAAAAYEAADRATVCFVGPLESYGALPVAVSPTADGATAALVAESVEPTALEGALTKAPVAVAVTWQQLAALPDGGDSLGRYVADGGRLVVVPDARSPVTDFGGRVPEWARVSMGRVEALSLPDEQVVTGSPREPQVSPAETSLPFWSRLRVAGRVAWAPVRVARAATLQPVAPSGQARDGRITADVSRVVAELEDGRPVLVHGHHGKGAITASGFAFDPAWTTLSQAPHFVVLVHTMVAGGLDENRDGIEIEAGAVPRPPTTDDSVEIVPFVGDVVAWSGQVGDMPVVPRAAAGVVRSGSSASDGSGNEAWTFSARGSAAEGRTTFLEGPKVAAAGSLNHVVSTLPAGGTVAAGLGRIGGEAGLYLPMLLLATAALVAEGLLGAPRPAGGVRR